MLATIIGTSGSTPAAAESRMLIPADGTIRAVGTVGGGCLDESVVTTVRNDEGRFHARIMQFELNDDVSDTGLTCGGTVTLLLEPVTTALAETYDAIINCHDEGEDCFLLTHIDPSGEVGKTLLDAKGTLRAGKGVERSRGGETTVLLAKAREAGQALREKSEKRELIVEYLRADPPLIIFGGGHVGKVVSQCAALAGFRVTLVDDRKAYANKDRFPEAHTVLCEGFVHAFNRLTITPSTFVVVVTRGHRHDEEVLEHVLKHQTRYTGMIGSKRKVKLTFENLVAKGIPPEILTSVHAPVGLDIGAMTAEEIGVSIVAELIAVRRKSQIRDQLSLSGQAQSSSRQS